MSTRYGCLFSLGVIATVCSLPPSFTAAAENKTLVAAALQDEPRKIPEDNTAYFSRADRKVRFQLVKLSGIGNEMLLSTNVRVIGPSGGQINLTADADGIATLENAETGLHAVVVAGENGHTAVPIAVRASEPADPLMDPPASSSPSIAKLALMDIDPQEVVRLTSSYLSPEMGGSFEDIDNAFAMTADTAQGLQYRVRLGDEGTLDGQVYSMLRSGVSTAGVEGTNVMIYRGNTLVARTTADQFGRFTVSEMVPGVYGVVGAGPAGYAAFAFEAYDAAAVTSTSRSDETLVSVRDGAYTLIANENVMARGSILPVLLIPPAMVPSVIDEIRMAGLAAGDGQIVDGALGTPVGSFGQAPMGGGGGGSPGSGGGSGGGFGGGSAGAGGGGLLGLAAIGGIAAAAIAAADDDNNDNFFGPPPVASPSSL